MFDSLWFPKFDKVKQFQTIHFSYPSQTPLNAHIDNIKEQLLDPTQASFAQKEKYKTRSVKVVADPLNISFEEGYMEEHKSCFLNELQKYMEQQESIVGSLKRQGLKRKNYELQPSLSLGDNLPETIREQASLLSEVQREWLIIDLRREDKLSEFLEYVLSKVNQDSFKEVLYLGNLVWEEFISVQDMGYSDEEIMGFAENLVSKHLQDLDLKFQSINYRGVQRENNIKAHSTESKQRLSQFKKFATFFTTTLLMVISGYFENPYTSSEQNYFKRELNEVGQEFQPDDDYADHDFSSEDQEVIINKRIKH